MVVSLFYIICGFLGYLIALISSLKIKSNRAINGYLLLVIILVATRHLTNGLSYFIDSIYFHKVIIGSNRFFILIIPSLYLYFREIIFPKNSFSVKDILHFISPIVFFILLQLIKFDVLGNFDLSIISYILFTVFTFYVSSYIFFCFRLINREVWSKKKDLKIKSHLFYHWSKFLMLFLVLSTLRVIISLYLRIQGDNLVSDSDDLWVSAIIWLPIYFKILISPEILYGYNALNSIIQDGKISSLHFDFWDINSKNDLNNLQHIKLKEIVTPNIIDYITRIEKKRFCYETFKINSFTISDFARNLNIPTSHLIYLFKYHSKISFADFKKSIRIRQAIDHIESGYLNKNTIESLAQKVGFSTYTSFYTSFKEITGKSPRLYVKNINIY
ncbi:helix-turn-helix domain-containing protein [Polaribacter filamentus]|uniref:helix-turn-helix domain-containing protein n=1 Tax=Polaribacter filamentus TaxID=53483 RepID=UPI000CF22D29|nr:AraC family transcriptional regulator [Polaribacter filamentus]